MPIALLSRRTVTPLPRTCFPNAKNPRLMKETGVLVALVESESSGRLVLDAVAARDAGVLVHDLSDAADHFEHFLRAGIDADAATDALIGFDNRVRHS